MHEGGKDTEALMRLPIAAAKLVSSRIAAAWGTVGGERLGGGPA